ncbi:LysR family transcriptional regulator [Dyella sp.]|uniref:LysR family transcriptional regulator n=1 Tax=Dyella sp. TaxID=1869338 RepID=UPI002ED66E51
MEFRQLKYFLAVAEHLHFTVAAERLGMAQPPLSQQIIKLEREIGTRLFVRHPRRVELTEAGVIFKERARRILDDVDDTLEYIKKTVRGESGKLLIGFAGSTVFHPRVATTLRLFQHSYPGVLVKAQESNSTALLNKVSSGEVDCALVRLPLDCGTLVVTPLVEEEMIAVLSASHRLAAQRSVDLAQLATDPLILFPREIGPELYDSIISACRMLGFSPRIAMESPQISSAVNMVAAGFGVSVIPSSMRHIHADGVAYLKIRNKGLKTAIALIARPRDSSATVRNFVQVLRDVSRGRGPPAPS